MSKPLTVAHLVPYSITFPLQHHNGRYDWLISTATRQAQNGLDVIIYSNPASQLDIPGITWRSVQGTFADSAAANSAILQQAFAAPDIDVYHSHFDNLHYTAAAVTKRSIVFTQHWWPGEETVALAAKYASPNVWAVPPTQYMYEFDIGHSIQTRGYIYHGIDLQTYRRTGEKKSDRLLFVGRIAPEKNLPTAIAAAKKAGLGLDIIGKVAPKNTKYWEGLADSIDGMQIQYLGSKSAAELVGYYNRATAVIFPSDIHEPFGLVAIEAQACGTPILMVRGGSRGELVADGVSGYLCSNVDDFAVAARQVASLSADDCVAFAAKFDIKEMISKYTQLYLELVR